MKTQKQIDSNLKTINTNIDTFELSAQTMRCKTKGGNDVRKKEDSAISQALYMARISNRPGYEYNSTISDLKKSNKDNQTVIVKDPIRFSGKYAFANAFGNKENLQAQIEKELTSNDLTKTRKKKLRKQLKEVIATIELSKSIDQDLIPREIATRDINKNKSLSNAEKIIMINNLK